MLGSTYPHRPGSDVEAATQVLSDVEALERGAADSSSCIHDLIAARAQARPSALAVVAHDGVLTYGELDRRSNYLATRLRARGVGPDVLVGLCLEPSAALVVGALSIWKAGGAYVALDPSYPDERLAFMLADARVSVLLTQDRVGARFAGRQLSTLTMDVGQEISPGESVAESVSTAPAVAPGPRHLAYVIYTSGSTGTPKGVMIEHRGLAALVRWHLRAFSVTSDDHASQVASPGFDATVWELWPYLAAGASAHIAGDHLRADARALCRWLVAQRITVSFLPTPLAEAALTLDWPPEAGLRLLLTGGDALHRYPPLGLPFTLVNNYGPTETTVVATSGVVPQADGAWQPPSIGRPIDHVHAYLVDTNLELVPKGEAGELLIGGPGVARGYLNREDLNRERFIADPFDGAAGGRLYRTGDLVRWRADGELEFLGRLDEQVKIRGFRIEPGEISATINSYPGVRSSIVVAREHQPGDLRLVAYWIPASDGRVSPDELRAYLSRRLPEYMVPSDFLQLDRLPMTSNGKVDRSALPGLEEAMSNIAYGIAPSNELERELIDMVAELLSLDRVGVDNNFFLLGGHSLLGAQLIARIRDRFDVDLTLRTLFDNPTVSAMAVEVERLLLAQLESLSDEEAEQLARSLEANRT